MVVRMRYLWIPATVFGFVLGHFTMPAPIVIPSAPAPIVVVADRPAPAPAPTQTVRYEPCWYGRAPWMITNSVPPCMYTNAGCCP